MITVDPFRERVQTLLARVAYKPGTAFEAIEKAPGVLLLRHTQLVLDVKSHYSRIEAGRKFYLSPYMTDEEILQTALLSVLVFEEHEAREWFLFDGRRLFSPHKSLTSLGHVEEVSRGDVRQA